MIEDAELRELFKIESEEHIQSLERDLLRLEAGPDRDAALEEALREAHSLKGAARMVGVRDVEMISHKIEDIIGRSKKEGAPITPETTDRICRALDAVKKLVGEAVTGAASGVNVTKAIETLMRGAKAPEEEKPAPKETENAPAEAHGGGSAAPGADEAVRKGAGETAYRIETVRVETRKLDSLMTNAGELKVMIGRLNRRLAQAEDALEAIEEASRRLQAGPYQRASGAAPKVRGQSPSLLHDRSIESPVSLREGLERAREAMSVLRDEIYEDNSRLESVSGALEGEIRGMRLLPFSTIFNLFPRMVRDIARERSKEAELIVEGADTGADKRILEEMKDPVMHMIRNALDHGIEMPEERLRAGKPRAGAIRLSARRAGGSIIIEVEDDGGGLDTEAIRKAALKRRALSEEALLKLAPEELNSLIFTSGLSTSPFVTDTSGRGVGLDVVRSNVERLKGSVSVESRPAQGCLMRVRLPASIATARVLITSVNGRRYAVPVEYVESSLLLAGKDVFLMEGRAAITHRGQAVSAVWLSDILGAGRKAPADAPHPCVIISSPEGRLGVITDDILDEQEIMLKPQSFPLRRVRNVSGSTVLGSGEICMVLNPPDMIRSARMGEAPPGHAGTEAAVRRAVLLVEDSITTRTLEKRILEGAGYETVTAVDGMDALDKLSGRRFDAVVTDVMMPNMDGLALTEKIRQDKNLKDLPVILVTTLSSDEDKKRGLDAGANAYIPKPSFDQKIFLETLKRLI